MIYILAGIAKSGKSLIANEILKTYQIRIISTDWIMMMLHYGNKDLNIDINRSDKSVSHMIEPYMEGLIKSLIGFKKDVLIEGVHIQPEFASVLQNRYPGLIHIVFLGYKNINPDIKKQELKINAKFIDNPWYINYNEEELSKLIHYLIKESDDLEKTCIKFKQTYIEVHNIINDKVNIINVLIKGKHPIT